MCFSRFVSIFSLFVYAGVEPRVCTDVTASCLCVFVRLSTQIENGRLFNIADEAKVVARRGEFTGVIWMCVCAVCGGVFWSRACCWPVDGKT